MSDRSRLGFTLLELVGGLLLVGIIACAVAHAFRPKEIVLIGHGCGVYPPDPLTYARLRMQGDFNDAKPYGEARVIRGDDAFVIRSGRGSVHYFLRPDVGGAVLVRRESDASCTGTLIGEEEICHDVTFFEVDARPPGIRVRIAMEDRSDTWVLTSPDDASWNWERVGTVD